MLKQINHTIWINELIPQSEPKAGQPLDILVLVKGKAVQGIKVGLGEDHPFNLTNEKVLHNSP